MNGYVQNGSSSEYWNPDPMPGTTPDITKAGIFERSDPRVRNYPLEHTLGNTGCIFIPIKQKYTEHDLDEEYTTGFSRGQEKAARKLREDFEKLIANK